MNTEICFKDRDLLVMKLLHYFITEKKYNPIILKGLNNEIWLENLNEDYQIIRINTGYVHNDEQLDFDLFKTKRILKKIQLKTFSFSLNSLSLFIDLGDNVDLTKVSDLSCVKVTNEDDIITSNLIIDAYPDIKDKLVFEEKGIELFSKITSDINKKNMIDQKEAEEVFSKKTPIVTYIIMGLCTLIFFITIVLDSSLSPSFLAECGGLNKLLVVYNSEFYRLFTCMFLHGSLAHLLSNMYALYAIGGVVENYYGKFRYIFIYILSGIVGSLSSLLFLSENSVSVGASGAIFGLMGALLYFGYNYRNVLNDAITKRILPVIGLNLMLGFMSSGIDNFAHIGGLIGGVLVSMAVGVKYRTSKKDEINGVICLTLLMCFLLFMLYN